MPQGIKNGRPVLLWGPCHEGRYWAWDQDAYLVATSSSLDQVLVYIDKGGFLVVPPNSVTAMTIRNTMRRRGIST